MSTLVKYVQAASEKKRYQINYVNWLDTGEFVVGVAFTVSPVDPVNPVVVDGIQVLPTGLGVQYYLSGGNDGKSYDINALLTTSIGPQKRLDEIVLAVREP